MDNQHLKPIISIFMGAAAADGNADVYEFDFIADNLSLKLGYDDSLVQDVLDEFEDFDASAFDLQTEADALSDLPEDDKLKIIQFLVELQEADGVVDFDEDDYLRDVANALGVDPSHLSDFVIELVEDDGPPAPPPLPKPQD